MGGPPSASSLQLSYFSSLECRATEDKPRLMRKEGDLGLHGLPSAKVSLHLPSGETVAHVYKAVRAEGLWELSLNTQEPNTTQGASEERRGRQQRPPAPDDMKKPSGRARCPLQYFCRNVRVYACTFEMHGEATK